MGNLLRKKVQQNLGDELWSRVRKKMELGESIPQVGENACRHYQEETFSKSAVTYSIRPSTTWELTLGAMSSKDIPELYPRRKTSSLN